MTYILLYIYYVILYYMCVKYYVSIKCAEPSVCVMYTLQPAPHRLQTVNSRLPSSINIINIAPGARKDVSLIMRNDITQVHYIDP